MASTPIIKERYVIEKIERVSLPTDNPAEPKMGVLVTASPVTGNNPANPAGNQPYSWRFSDQADAAAQFFVVDEVYELSFTRVEKQGA